MAIKFHCSHCGREIKAPDNSAGSKGKCPSCKEFVYVPDPEADEELDLAPEPQSESDPDTDAALMAALAAEGANLGEVDDEPPLSEAALDDPHAEGGVTLGAIAAAAEAGRGNPPDQVVAWLNHMASGDLEKAEAVAAQLKTHKEEAMAAINSLAGNVESTPGLPELPPPVINGFLKQLTAELK